MHFAGLIACIRESNKVSVSEAIKIMLEKGIIQKLEETEHGDIVAADDKVAIGHLRFSHLPQPYMGDPSRAKIFLLYGSPSVLNNHDGVSHRDFNRDHKEFIFNSYDLDSSENKAKKYPLYALDPTFKKYPIYIWWRNHLDHLITESGLASEIVSERLFAAQYFSYFLENPDANDIPILKSQKYMFNLIEEAITAKKMIVILNKRRKWYSETVNLETYRKEKCRDTDGNEYSRVIQLNFPLGTNLTRGNMGPGDFDRILKILRGEQI